MKILWFITVVELLLVIKEFDVGHCQLFERPCQTANCIKFSEMRAKKQMERGQMLRSMRLDYMRSEFEWIPDLPFDDLVQRLQTRNLTATQVLSGFIGKTARVTSEFNCVTEFVPEAMKLAMELDTLPTVKGPLHGVPFCVKDDHNVEGMDTTLGYSRNLYNPASKSATLIKIFGDLGAIVFCKTNVPQTLMSFGSDNPVFGTTLNPLNSTLSPGGSSSGTACLVSAKAIHFGTGTDMVGSGRIPAHFTGISSLMTTSKRLSYEGITLALPNVIGLSGVSALFAESPKTLATIFRALTEGDLQNKNDPLTLPIPFNLRLFENKRPLRFGYFTSIPFFPTLGDTPSIVLKTKRDLESLGHTLVPFDMPDAYEYMKIQGDLIFADGGKYFSTMLKDDKIAQSFKTFNFGIQFPSWQRRLVGFAPVSRRLQLTLRAGVDSEASHQLQDIVGKARRISRDILNQMKEKDLDLILSPVFPVPAVRVDDPANLFLAVAYVALWNLVDFPAGVIPMGQETGRNIMNDEPTRDLFINLAKTNLKHALGMPIGVQIIGKPFQEELILRTMTELQNLNEFNKMNEI